MERKGLMIDYEYCTGCHSCEIACKQEHRYPVGRGGLYLNEIISERPDQDSSHRLPSVSHSILQSVRCENREG